jgi:transglutaminase-like putative cysteine protease
MRLLVRHRTEFGYSAPSRLLAQLLRMTPREHAGQRVLRWSVRDERGRMLPSFRDGFGNVTHLHTLNEPHRAAGVEVEGLVETRDTGGVLARQPEPLPPAFFTRETSLTAADAALEALAAEAGGEREPLARLHRLMSLVHAHLAYRTGVTTVATSAAEAWARGAGVCQDFAQVLVTAARALGQPARYVGGYLHGGSATGAPLASHAWAEAWLPDLGWVGFDASHGICPTERYVRASVGRDYADAAPVRGVRRGPAGQSMQVRIQVAEASAQ